jgi:U3 small nucleolar RNA-associated protein 10
VTNYMSYVLESVTTILTNTTNLDKDEAILLDVLLGVLIESFEQDEDGRFSKLKQASVVLIVIDFWQPPSHFSAVAEPLVVQLEHCAESIAITRVIPAISALGYAASSADHFKAINTKILQLMRSDSAAVRLVAVKCERSLTDRLGEDWLALLPEMLPFIVELLEDDDERVERETRTWIRSVEDILGESLEGMLQ